MEFNTEKLPLLLQAIAEYAEKIIPESGLFDSCTINFKVPDLYVKEAGFRFQTDHKDRICQRRVSLVVLFPDDSGRQMSHDLFSGTKGEILDWLRSSERPAEIVQELVRLNESVKNHD